MTSPRVVDTVGLGPACLRDLSSEMRRYINIFSTPGRLILDELFGAFGARERLIFPAFLNDNAASVCLSRIAHIFRFRELFSRDGLASTFLYERHDEKVLSFGARMAACRPLSHLQELDHEVQSCLRWNVGAFACVTVAELGGNRAAFACRRPSSWRRLRPTRSTSEWPSEKERARLPRST